VRIAVFAKAPVAGQVKTRLAPVLAPEAAARLHGRLVLHALREATAAGAGEVELWCAPDTAHGFFGDCARQFGVRLRGQGEGSLGARMARAFATAHAEGQGLVLLGSDCPALDRQAIAAAAQALSSQAVAIAPAEDGGYALIALSAPQPSLFEGIAWGTASVMAETRRKLAAARIAWTELPRTWDVDRPEDYARLVREPWWTAESA
jgi:hypothetical protein